MFHAAELFGQNVRFFLTEPLRSPAGARRPGPRGGSSAAPRGRFLGVCRLEEDEIPAS